MTPYELARHECANIRKDGSCLGIPAAGLVWQGRQINACLRDKCLLAGKPMRPCSYFEGVVLPLADQPTPRDKLWLQSQRRKARRQYLAARKMEIPEESELRRCPQCGEPLAKRQRMCSHCSRIRRRERQRELMRRKRYEREEAC